MRVAGLVLVALLLGGCEDTSVGPVFAFNNDLTGIWDARFDFATRGVGNDTTTFTRLSGTVEITPNFSSEQIGSMVNGTVTATVQLAGNVWADWSGTQPRGSGPSTPISISQDTLLHMSWDETRAGSTIRVPFRAAGSTEPTVYTATWVVSTVRVPGVLYDSTATHVFEMRRR